MKASISRLAAWAVMGGIVSGAASALALDDTAIYVMNVDGSNVQRLTTYQGQGNGATSPTWPSREADVTRTTGAVGSAPSSGSPPCALIHRW